MKVAYISDGFGKQAREAAAIHAFGLIILAILMGGGGSGMGYLGVSLYQAPSSSSASPLILYPLLLFYGVCAIVGIVIFSFCLGGFYKKIRPDTVTAKKPEQTLTSELSGASRKSGKGGDHMEHKADVDALAASYNPIPKPAKAA